MRPQHRNIQPQGSDCVPPVGRPDMSEPMRKTRRVPAYYSALTEDRDPGAAPRQGLRSNGISPRHASEDESLGGAAWFCECTLKRRPVQPSGESPGEFSGYYRFAHENCIVFRLSCQGPFFDLLLSRVDAN